MELSSHAGAEYYLYETTESDNMLGQYLTYGLHAYVAGELYAQYRDISTHKNKVVELISLLNQEHLAPCQLPDILEDFLA